MKNLILAFFLTCATTLFAKPVNEATAKKVGLSFLQLKTQLPLENLSLNTLHLGYKEISKSVFGITENATAYFYIFNVDNDKGFVIVSADDIALPVLGYSTEHAFNANDIPTNTAKWFEGYKNEMRYAIGNNIVADEETKAKWNTLIEASTININAAQRGTAVVSPLVQTHWNQSPYYNALCPYDNQYSDRTVTGCVATAMAQVIKYWNYPTTGTGFHSYNHQKYGTLSANFGATTYQWGSMPNTVTSANNAVATLMYHCGVSVDMSYGVASTGGSSAQTLDVAAALKTYFGYDVTVQGLYRTSYSDAQWINLLQAELNSSRPIQYAGTGSGGGHSFVCDGYDNSNYFHFNWGWGGSSDGYFNLNALNPGSLGTGGGTGGFNSNQRAIIGIKPPSATLTYLLKLYNTVTPSSSSITFGQAFTVSTNIANYGTASFNGDYCAAIFDNTNTFVDYVEIKTGQSLQNGYHYSNNLVFSNTGMAAMMPGTYTVGIFHRPTGGQWSLVADNGSYTNFPTITVTYNNSIALNSVITASPSTLIKGQPATFNLNIRNDAASTFYGKYYVALYNLDGSLAQVIDSVSESSGLPSGYTYSSPYLSFYNPNITVNAGSYLVGVLHKSNTSTLQLTGANYFQNPTKVIVKNPDLVADMYEVNDTITQSYNLSVNFTGQTANPKTTGSNCHKGNDYDFYKIILPIGYNYTITPRLHDSYNSGNGNTYTLDGLFSYSTDGTTWSEAFDDTVINKIISTNGGTIYFAVAPYFAGGTGTYLLDIKIDKVSSYVNGNLLTPVKKAIANVNLKISKDSTNSFLVNSKYETALNYNGNFTLRPTKNNDLAKANGVNSVDALLVQRHILNTTKLNNAYKLIAADVDGNKTVNSVDVLRIKRLILGTDTTFKNTLTTENRLWAFVDSAYQFPDTTNPFPFKDSISFINLTSNKTNQTFIGVKLGDVNFDWNSAVAKPSAVNCLPSTVNSQPLTENCVQLVVTNKVTQSPSFGGVGEAAFSTLNSETLSALQTTIHFDNTKYEFISIGNNKYNIDFNTTQANTTGNISLVWIDKQGETKTFKAGEELFSLVLKPKAINNLQFTINDLKLNDDITTTAAFDEALNRKGIVLIEKSTDNSPLSTANGQLWTIYPNPAHSQFTVVGKSMTDKGQIIITNMLGKQVAAQTLSMGNNTIDIANLAKGMYFVSVITNEGKQTKKLVVE